MRRRQWDADTKAKIVIQGLQGRAVAELCNEYQISQSLYYQWRDQFLAHAARAFDVPQSQRKEARLAHENARLKTLVGELTLEQKKRRAAGLKRRRSLRVVRCDDHLLPRIQALKPSIRFGGIGESGRTCMSQSSCRSTRSGFSV